MRKYSSIFLSLLLAASVGLAASFLSVDVYAACPTAEATCFYWPPLINLPPGTPTQWCDGLDCFEMNYASENARVVAVDDEGPYPTTWVAWTNGVVNNLSCNAVIPRGNHRQITLPLPDLPHCAIMLETDEHLYLWFFASNPATSCLGWAECQIY